MQTAIPAVNRFSELTKWAMPAWPVVLKPASLADSLYYWQQAYRLSPGQW
jgi:hypothetical protein